MTIVKDTNCIQTEGLNKIFSVTNFNADFDKEGVIGSYYIYKAIVPCSIVFNLVKRSSL